MKNINDIRGKIKSAIIERISPLQSVCSITFVGSFVYSNKISTISDIDTIVIVDKLTENVFKSIQEKASLITGMECGLDDHDVKLNMSFGPLKFNDPKTIVFHLMVYDKEGHRQHVIASPFTCYDWEYYEADYGTSLKDIYTAAPLQLNDLVGSRRSLKSYLDDLNKGVITYRHYSFSNDRISEVKETYPMDDRHKKEYAYHVMKFLMLNFLKIIHQTNLKFNDQDLCENFLLNTDKDIFSKYVNFFLELSKWKNDGEKEPDSIFIMLEGFIEHLTIYLDKVNSKATTVSFIRHAKTPLNDGSFLGIGRDPSILGFEQEVIPKTVFDKIYTSNLKRSQETAAYLSGDCIINSYLLNEINYGLAEGITFNEISLKFPDIAKGWLKKEDPNFPEGECQKDVEKRLNEFITEELISSEAQDIAVVTHLVIIRVLLAKFYNAPISNWFHIRPEHLEDLQCLVFNKKLVPSLSDAQRIKYRDQLQLWNQE